MNEKEGKEMAHEKGFNFKAFLKTHGISLVGKTVEEADKIVSSIVTTDTIINLDGEDIENLCKDSSILCIATASSDESDRIGKAFSCARDNLRVPSDCRLKVMVMIWMPKTKPMTMSEVSQLSNEIESLSNEDIIWGLSYDEALDADIKIALMASY